MRSLFLTFLAVAAIVAFILPTHMEAKANEERGVKDSALDVGASIPKLELLDAAGYPVTYDKLTGENGAIFMFIRSLDWCRYCKAQVNEWNKVASKFEAEGYPVSVISYDKPETSRLFNERQKITLTTLYDKDSKLIKHFGILNDSYDADSRFYGIPYPFIYVIDKDGKITHRYAEESYKNRPAIEMVLKDIGGE